MDCRKIDRNELAEKYLHGQLDESSQDEFEVHLLECVDCLQTVELLQAVRFDLSERAPAIRIQTLVPRPFFRWQWIAVACSFFIVGSLGLLELGRIDRGHQQAAAAHSQPSADHSASSPPDIASNSRPSNGQGDSQLIGDGAPTSGSPPRADLNIEGKRAPSSSVAQSSATVPHVLHGTSDTVVRNGSSNSGSQPTESGSGEGGPLVSDSSPQQTQAPAGQEKAAAGSTVKTTNTSGLLSDEGERELFRLGTVRPAPYTFSGLSPHAGFGIPVSPSGAKQGHVKSADERRPLFKDGMLAYLDRNYDDATDLLEKDVQREPDAADANFYLGVCELLNGKPGESLAHLRIAVRESSPPFAQQAHFYLAKAHLQTRDLAAAEKELTAAAGMVGQLTASARADLASLQTLRTKENR